MSIDLHKTYPPKKIVVLGEGGVGKTTLIKTFTAKSFFHNSKQTIAVQFHTSNLYIGKKKYKLQIWDFGGQDHFKEMGVFREFCKGSDGALLCYDVTDISTLFALSEWATFIDKNIPKVLVGTKTDLDPYFRSSIDVSSFKEKLQCEFSFECSAKDVTSVNNLFFSFLSVIINKEANRKETSDKKKEKVAQSIII